MLASITQIKGTWCIVEWEQPIKWETKTYVIFNIHKPFDTFQKALSHAEYLSHICLTEILQIITVTPELKKQIEEYHV